MRAIVKVSPSVAAKPRRNSDSSRRSVMPQIGSLIISIPFNQNTSADRRQEIATIKVEKMDKGFHDCSYQSAEAILLPSLLVSVAVLVVPV